MKAYLASGEGRQLRRIKRLRTGIFQGFFWRWQLWSLSCRPEHYGVQCSRTQCVAFVANWRSCLPCSRAEALLGTLPSLIALLIGRARIRWARSFPRGWVRDESAQYRRVQEELR